MKTRFRFSTLTGFATLALAFMLMAAPAFGAEPGINNLPSADATATSMPQVPINVNAEGVTAFQGMRVNLVTDHSSGTNQRVYVVGGFLPEGTPLPAKVQIAVPKGAQIMWVGEGNAGDTQITNYTTATQGNLDVYSFSINQLNCQIEWTTENPFKESKGTTGTVTAGTLSYTPLTDLMYLYVGAEIPSGSVPQGTGFTNDGTTQQGTTIWSRQFTEAKAKTPYTVDMSYADATSQDRTSPVIVVVIILIVIAVAVLVFMLLRKRLSGEAEPEPEPESSGKKKQSKTLVICPVCGKKVDPSDAFCKNCGEALKVKHF